MSPFVFYPLATIPPPDKARAAAEGARIAAEAAAAHEVAKLAERASLHVRDCGGVPRVYAQRALELEAEGQLLAAEKSAAEVVSAEAEEAAEGETLAYVESADIPTRRAIETAVEKLAVKVAAIAADLAKDVANVASLVSTAEDIASFLRARGLQPASHKRDTLASDWAGIARAGVFETAGALVAYIAPSAVAQRKAERASWEVRRECEARDRALAGLDGHGAQDRARAEFNESMRAQRLAPAPEPTRFVVDQSEVARREVEQAYQAAALRDAPPAAQAGRVIVDD